MKTNGTDVLLVQTKSPPTVEIDTEAAAAYVRFKRTKVAKTLRHSSKWPIITIDLDSQGEVVGVEFVGVKKFNLNYLLSQTPIKAPSRSVAQASYVSAEALSASK
jgi:uncharacterized protein YuzE